VCVRFGVVGIVVLVGIQSHHPNFQMAKEVVFKFVNINLRQTIRCQTNKSHTTLTPVNIQSY